MAADTPATSTFAQCSAFDLRTGRPALAHADQFLLSTGTQSGFQLGSQRSASSANRVASQVFQLTRKGVVLAAAACADAGVQTALMQEIRDVVSKQQESFNDDVMYSVFQTLAGRMESARKAYKDALIKQTPFDIEAFFGLKKIIAPTKSTDADSAENGIESASERCNVVVVWVNSETNTVHSLRTGGAHLRVSQENVGAENGFVHKLRGILPASMGRFGNNSGSSQKQFSADTLACSYGTDTTKGGNRLVLLASSIQLPTQTEELLTIAMDEQSRVRACREVCHDAASLMNDASGIIAVLDVSNDENALYQDDAEASDLSYFTSSRTARATAVNYADAQAAAKSSGGSRKGILALLLLLALVGAFVLPKIFSSKDDDAQTVQTSGSDGGALPPPLPAPPAGDGSTYSTPASALNAARDIGAGSTAAADNTATRAQFEAQLRRRASGESWRDRAWRSRWRAMERRDRKKTNLAEQQPEDPNALSNSVSAIVQTARTFPFSIKIPLALQPAALAGTMKAEIVSTSATLDTYAITSVAAPTRYESIDSLLTVLSDARATTVQTAQKDARKDASDKVQIASAKAVAVKRAVFASPALTNLSPKNATIASYSVLFRKPFKVGKYTVRVTNSAPALSTTFQLVVLPATLTTNKPAFKTNYGKKLTYRPPAPSLMKPLQRVLDSLHIPMTALRVAFAWNKGGVVDSVLVPFDSAYTSPRAVPASVKAVNKYILWQHPRTNHIIPLETIRSTPEQAPPDIVATNPIVENTKKQIPPAKTTKAKSKKPAQPEDVELLVKGITVDADTPADADDNGKTLKASLENVELVGDVELEYSNPDAQLRIYNADTPDESSWQPSSETCVVTNKEFDSKTGELRLQLSIRGLPAKPPAESRTLRGTIAIKASAKLKNPKAGVSSPPADATLIVPVNVTYQ